MVFGQGQKRLFAICFGPIGNNDDVTHDATFS